MTRSGLAIDALPCGAGLVIEQRGDVRDAWRGDPSPYGPMWEALAAGTSLLGGNSLWTNLILFKALVVLAYAASVGLTYAILRSWKPD